MRRPRRRTEAERLEELERVLEDLRVAAEGATLVVEGHRDLQALERLGIGGEHLAVHRGRPLHEVIEQLATCRRVVLLVDWDRSGGRLHASLRDNLQARVLLDTETRRRIALCTGARSLEEVPAELEALRRSVHPGRHG